MAAATAVTLTANRDQRCDELSATVARLRQENRSLRASRSRLAAENKKLRKSAEITAAHIRRSGELAAEVRHCRLVMHRMVADIPFAVQAAAVGWRNRQVPGRPDTDFAVLLPSGAAAPGTGTREGDDRAAASW
jgi:hypothetical protein